jgi:GNAT superfamily N-acetyltransferase
MLRDLGDGLILRRATAADAEALAAFNADQIRGQDAPEPFAPVGVWTRDLLTGRHPTFKPEDALIVEERKSGAIVSSSLLVSQAWAYGGAPIRVGQIELVATRPEYRGRGLVRAQFEALHRWSAERGEVLQAISGIPWFYRQFGYEMALERGGGPRADLASLEPPAPGAALPFRVRPMRPEDLAFAAGLDAQARERYLVTVPRDERLWRYELSGHTAGSGTRIELRVIETSAGEPVGTLGHIPALWVGAVALTRYEVRPGVSWRATWPAVLAYLRATGDTYAARDPKARFTQIQLWHMGSAHPLYRALRFADRWRPYAFYTRIDDLAAFLRAVGPTLERRLAASPLSGHTGDLTLSTYRAGARLAFTDGRLSAVAPWRPSLDVVGQEFGTPSTDPRRPMALFPGVTVNQLLLGFRSLEELEGAFPDCMVRQGDGRALLDALFPKTPSDVWALL